MRNTFNLASGNTTVAISRPSTTPPPRSATQTLCRSRSSRRTSEFAATELTARVTASPRISAVASTPSTKRPSLDMSKTVVIASWATTASSLGSTPWRRAAHVMPRYIAPVSRYGRLRTRANSRAIVDFPAPAGPSIATTLTLGVITNWYPERVPLRNQMRSEFQQRHGPQTLELNVLLRRCRMIEHRPQFGQ